MDNPLFDFTRGEMIKALGMNKRTLYRTMPKLEEMNIAKVSRKIGKAKLYTLNRDSPIVACLRSIEKELSTSTALSLRETRGIDKEHEEVLKEAIRELNAEQRKEALE